MPRRRRFVNSAFPPPLTSAQRRTVYKFYRWLNVVHVLLCGVGTQPYDSALYGPEVPSEFPEESSEILEDSSEVPAA